jgi:hypothetical protein
MRTLTAAVYGIVAITAPITGAWLTATVRHVQVSPADGLTFLLAVALVAYAGVCIVLTPSRRERKLTAPQSTVG